MHFGIYIDGLVQDCSNSIALAMELLQSCTEPSIYGIKLISDAISSINFREKWTWLEDLIVFSYLLLVFKFEEEVTLDEEKSLPKRLKVNNDVAFTGVGGGESFQKCLQALPKGSQNFNFCVYVSFKV